MTAMEREKRHRRLPPLPLHRRIPRRHRRKAEPADRMAQALVREVVLVRPSA